MTPALAYGLVTVGLMAIYYECCRPGTITAGAAGSTLLLIGLARLGSFGITREGLALAAAALVLVAAETWWRWAGPPGLAGALVLTLAATRLNATAGMSWAAAVALSWVITSATVVLGSLAVQGYWAKRL